jgi:hypothetical protein
VRRARREDHALAVSTLGFAYPSITWVPRTPPRRTDHPGPAGRPPGPDRRPGSCGTSALTQAALREDRLSLYAEPIVDLRSHSVVAHELVLGISPSLKSWLGEGDRAARRPPAAVDLDLWVVDQAARLVATGRETHVSVCASSLRAPQFPRLVGRALRRAGGDPRNVTLTIDESVLDRTFAISFAARKPSRATP